MKGYMMLKMTTSVSKSDEWHWGVLRDGGVLAVQECKVTTFPMAFLIRSGFVPTL